MITEKEAVGVYMHCSNKRPDGVYCTEVDIIEYARLLEQFFEWKAKKPPEDPGAKAA